MARKAGRVKPKADRCPSGHELPHRTAAGRCSPHDCVDQLDLPVTVVVPAAPKFLPGEERMHVLKRLDSVAPAMLEARIAAAVKGDAAAQDALLDRAGFTRKPEGNVDFSGPVLVLRPEQLNLPWKAVNDGRVLEAGGGAARNGTADGGAPEAAPVEVQPVLGAHQPELQETEPGPVHRVWKPRKAKSA